VAETTGFDALVQRRDKCTNVGGRICRAINVSFFPGLNIICFTFCIHLLAQLHIRLCIYNNEILKLLKTKF
jgi:hypothetical protein